VTEFAWPVRVYHTAYVRFMERARTEWLRSIGLSHTRLAQEEGLVFAVISVQIEYCKPARLDDLLQITSQARLSGGASVEFSQTVCSERGETLARGTVRVACLDAERMLPRRLPSKLREVWH
jgi:acyl-CoA thioester hydrolase